MKRINSLILLSVIFGSLILFSCGNSKEDKSEVEIKGLDIPEFDMLMDHLEYTGDFINSTKTPSYIKAESLHAILNTNINIIDLRKKEDFDKGHIQGAINVPLNKLIKLLEEDIYPAKVEKNILVCYTGQESAYAASALRLLGYANFWNLKYGMSSWNKTFAIDNWTKVSSSKHRAKLEVTGNNKAEPKAFPELKTGELCCIDMLENRVQAIFNEGFEQVCVTADQVFSSLDDYYIINYWPEAHYNMGHIPGAIQYQARESLKRSVDLKTLPIDKPILVYCYTGQTAAYIVSYLRIIGYDAFSLKNGANGFMADVMGKNNLPGWYPSKMNNYNFVSSGN